MSDLVPCDDGAVDPTEALAALDPDAAFAALEAQAKAAEAFAEGLSRRSATPALGLPCPSCEAVSVHRLGGAPRLVACDACAHRFDPSEPLPVRLHAMEAVVRATEATVMVIAAGAAHPVSMLLGLMGPGLRAGFGQIVTVHLDPDREGDGARARIADALGVSGLPAIAYYRAGARLGAISLPGGTSGLGGAAGALAGFAGLPLPGLGPLLGGAAGLRLPMPFVDPKTAGRGAAPGEPTP